MATTSNTTCEAICPTTATTTTTATAPRPTSGQALWVVGWIMIASGIFHMFVMLADGGRWEGAVSWRKPILFGVSTGLTAISLGWLLGLLRPVRYDRWLSPLVALVLAIEVGLITVQQWRGEASHFNASSPWNSFVDHSITYLVAAAAVYIFWLTWRSWGKLRGPSDINLAARSGMLFLSLSCLIGFGILIYGQQQATLGRSPELVGTAGVLKFPHGVAIHAIQLLPVLCWVFCRLGLSVNRRTKLVGWATASMAIFLLFSLAQTLGGRARFDLTLGTGTLLCLAVVLWFPVLKAAMIAIAQRASAAERQPL